MKRSKQAEARLPNPEMRKLRAFVGRWICQAEFSPGPFGPGGRATIEYTGQMVLGGFFFVGRWRWRQKGAPADIRGLQIDRYDPVNKNIASNWYQDDGSTFSGVLMISGNTYTWDGRWSVGGKSFLFRDIFVVAPDGKSAGVKSESSADGKTWTPFSKGKYTKIKPAARK